MKVIIDIAKAELKKLFFSPVAFLLLVIFSFLIGVVFQRTWETLMGAQLLGYPIVGASSWFFSMSVFGFYDPLLSYIHYFFPLLTMNIMSRDMGSGAFKLLLSSPVKNRQIILGKYLSMVAFAFLLCMLIFMGSIYAIKNIENADLPLAVTGLLGIFLLCCTYAAIGLYMSSITNYSIIAAIGTLCILVFLSFVGNLWQDVPVVRDITYWLALNGRAKMFLFGMIASEDLIYFLAVILFFLCLTLIRLKGSRAKKSGIQLATQYLVIIAAFCATGYFTSLPAFKLYWDITRTDDNTLTPESLRIMEKIDGGLTVTTYANLLDNFHNTVLPYNRKKEEERFEQYTRFKPAIKFEYVYYAKKVPGSWYDINYPNTSEKALVDTLRKTMDISFDVISYDELKTSIDLSDENFQTVRLLKRENGQQTFLRFYDDNEKVADEPQITAALKRIAEPLPSVGFVTGHGERSSAVFNDRGYSLLASEKSFRHSFLNNGFNFEDVSLMAPVPDHIELLLIADARKPFSDTEIKHYKEYVHRGGNLFIAGDPDSQEIMNGIAAPLGISFAPGSIVHTNPQLLQDMLGLQIIKDTKWVNPVVELMTEDKKVLMMNGTAAIHVDSIAGYTIYPLFETDSTGYWRELETPELIDDSAVYNPGAGELYGKQVTVLAMEKDVKGKKQRIIVTGDADWLSNGEVLALKQKFEIGNYQFLNGAFYYLSGDRVPINTSRPPKTDIGILTTQEDFAISSIVIGYGIPAILLVIGLFIWIRRKGR